MTWHLHGSLPVSACPPASKLFSGQAFAWLDRGLDAIRYGPVYLRQEAVARLVVNSLRRGVELGHYLLHAFVVMPNHLHVLLTPQVPASRLLQSLKGYTARQANRILGRIGESFWQSETNPVKAGMVKEARDYPWSSAAGEQEPGFETSLEAANRSIHATKEQ